MNDLKLFDLIALPHEAKSHLSDGHILSTSTPANFVSCSCGISFRVGVIVDRTTLIEQSIHGSVA